MQHWWRSTLRKGLDSSHPCRHPPMEQCAICCHRPALQAQDCKRSTSIPGLPCPASHSSTHAVVGASPVVVEAAGRAKSGLRCPSAPLLANAGL